MNKEEILNQFYTAFTKGDWKTMISFYHEDIEFNDPIFKRLNYKEVTSMWEMLLSSSKNMEVNYTIKDIKNDICANWIASYIFSKTNRKVINNVIASIEIKDGKIIKHTDDFNFHKWSRQSLGFVGTLFGKTKWLRNKIAVQADLNLQKFIYLKESIK